MKYVLHAIKLLIFGDTFILASIPGFDFWIFNPVLVNNVFRKINCCHGNLSDIKFYSERVKIIYQ